MLTEDTVNGFIDIDANAESTKVFYLGLDARMEGKAVARIHRRVE